MIIEEKFWKIIDSCKRGVDNYKANNKKAVVGDVHFILENAQEIIYILTDQLSKRDIS
ncbi:hypothetical protein [Siminovitchia fordii]|uniref:Uncharacterized protein n=1 Tax=Siminovitchia fordii TaxID=254759 RepID=A0ABQ4KA22_9BACI|nr:hypothetical protein [Siminovitchia fordii]GIN22574.1 hypothetical protein J1TS3_37080 [Siminovitchia fordii]